MSTDERLNAIDSEVKPKTEDLTEERIREITRMLFLNFKVLLKEKELFHEIIRLIKCDLKTAKGIVKRMEELGLDFLDSSINTATFGYRYDITSFGNMCGYITDEEVEEREIYFDEELKRQEKDEEEREEAFYAKYGKDKTKWSEKVWDSYKYGDEGWKN